MRATSGSSAAQRRLPGLLAGVVLGLVTVGSGQRAAGAELDLGGYFKSFAVAYAPAELEGSAAPSSPGTVWASNNRGRANARLDLLPSLDLDASYDLSLRIQDRQLSSLLLFPTYGESSIYRVRDLNRVVWSDRDGTDDRVLLLQNLDRLYATLRLDWFDVYLGRQAIAWGSARAINPTDVIAPFLYTEIDTEDRVGVDAARVRVPLGAMSELDAGYVAGPDFAWNESALFARTRFYVLRTDVALLAMSFRRHLLFGIDLARSLRGAGVWLEAAQVLIDEDVAVDLRPLGVIDDDYLRLSAGADYNLSSGIYGFVEYHFNGAGASDPADYFGTLFTSAYQDGSVYQLGRHYIIPGITWQMSALNVLGGQALVNLSDGSLILAPSFEHNATENLYLSLGGYIGIGESPAAVPVPPCPCLPLPPGTLVPRFRSEFGAYPASYFAFLRYYF